MVNTKPNARVKISGFGDNFQNWFLDLVEDSASEVNLVPMVLDRAMFDHEIIAKLGGVTKVITALGEIFSLMAKQPEGPKSKAGQLRADGYANIFYVSQPVKKLADNRFSYVNLAGSETEEKVQDSQYLFENNGQWYVLRAVRVLWYDYGWGVDASSVERPGRWDNGSQVFSRKILDPSFPCD